MKLLLILGVATRTRPTLLIAGCHSSLVSLVMSRTRPILASLSSTVLAGRSEGVVAVRSDICP